MKPEGEKKKRGRPRRIGPPPVAEKWLVVDWDLTDAEIAEQMHVSRQRVHQVRTLLGKRRKPPPPPSPTQLAEAWLKRYHRRAPEMLMAEAAEEAAVPRSVMSEAASRLGVTFYRYKPVPRWKTMPINWALPTADLQAIWRLRPGEITSLRKSGTVPEARWDAERDRDDRAYEGAIRAEKRKAVVYWGRVPKR